VFCGKTRTNMEEAGILENPPSFPTVCNPRLNHARISTRLQTWAFWEKGA